MYGRPLISCQSCCSVFVPLFCRLSQGPWPCGSPQCECKEWDECSSNKARSPPPGSSSLCMEQIRLAFGLADMRLQSAVHVILLPHPRWLQTPSFLMGKALYISPLVSPKWGACPFRSCKVAFQGLPPQAGIDKPPHPPPNNDGVHHCLQSLQDQEQESELM